MLSQGGGFGEFETLPKASSIKAILCSVLIYIAAAEVLSTDHLVEFIDVGPNSQGSVPKNKSIPHSSEKWR